MLKMLLVAGLAVGCQDARTTTSPGQISAPTTAIKTGEVTTDPGKAAKAAKEERKHYTRDELRALVMDKNPENLYRVIGRPARSSYERDRRFTDYNSYTFLYYPNLSTDPFSLKPENVRLKLSSAPNVRVIDIIFGG